MGVGLLLMENVYVPSSQVLIGTRITLGIKSLARIMQLGYMAGACLIMTTKRKARSMGCWNLLGGFS